MARARINVDDTGVEVFDRATFFAERFDYKEGECCTFLCPYGGGKTQLALEALVSVASPDMQATIFVMKPKDKTIARFLATIGKAFELVRDWPPSQIKFLKRIFGKRPPGYVLWPRDTGNIEFDEYNHRRIFKRALNLMYSAAKKRPNIMFIDETFSIDKELGLRRELERAWSKGRFGNGLWAASQRPVWISGYAYQAQHIFLGYDADQRTQDRYAEIGAGFDPAVILAILKSLKPFQFLYISREQRAMCIVDAN